MKKIRFNVFDLLIVVLIVLVAAYGGYRVIGKSTSADTVGSTGTVTARFTIEFTEKRDNMVDKFKEGDRVFIGEKEKSEGVVYKVEVRDAQKLVLDALNGEYVLSTIPNRYDILLTVDTESTVAPDTIKAGGQTPIRVGEELAVRSRSAAGSGFVTNLEVVK